MMQRSASREHADGGWRDDGAAAELSQRGVLPQRRGEPTPRLASRRSGSLPVLGARKWTHAQAARSSRLYAGDMGNRAHAKRINASISSSRVSLMGINRS